MARDLGCLHSFQCTSGLDWDLKVYIKRWGGLASNLASPAERAVHCRCAALLALLACSGGEVLPPCPPAGVLKLLSLFSSNFEEHAATTQPLHVAA